ncbi:hypothetical protein O9929_09085 [Vibrio lentus]|nr:hypothetical protein [Vibrio lentus]
MRRAGSVAKCRLTGLPDNPGKVPSSNELYYRAGCARLRVAVFWHQLVIEVEKNLGCYNVGIASFNGG